MERTNLKKRREMILARNRTTRRRQLGDGIAGRVDRNLEPRNLRPINLLPRNLRPYIPNFKIKKTEFCGSESDLVNWWKICQNKKKSANSGKNIYSNVGLISGATWYLIPHLCMMIRIKRAGLCIKHKCGIKYHVAPLIRPTLLYIYFPELADFFLFWLNFSSFY
jgi:hypothetical protein